MAFSPMCLSSEACFHQHSILRPMLLLMYIDDLSSTSRKSITSLCYSVKDNSSPLHLLQKPGTAASTRFMKDLGLKVISTKPLDNVQTLQITLIQPETLSLLPTPNPNLIFTSILSSSSSSLTCGTHLPDFVVSCSSFQDINSAGHNHLKVSPISTSELNYNH